MSKVHKTMLSLLVLGAVLILGACASAGGSQALQVSGTVETRQVVISSDLGGPIAEVDVQEGDSVEVGDMLLRLDDSTYQAQQAQAEAGLEAARGQLAAVQAQDKAAKAGVAAAQANLDAAQAQLDLTRAGALLEDNTSGKNAWVVNVPDAFDRPGWYFDQGEQIDAAQKLVESASADLQDALDAVDELLRQPEFASVAQAEGDLAQARAAYLLADQMRREPVSGENAAEVRQALRDRFDQAEQALTDAQDRVDGLLSDETAQTLLDRRIDLSLARERYRLALEGYYGLLTGEQSLRVQAARGQVDAASAAVTQAQASAEAAYAGVSQAQQAVDQAQAALDLIQVQIDKLTLRSPISGVVLTLAAAEGEMLLPGTPALTLGKVDELTITVYIPEDRYGEVSVGDQAQVSADSFPGQTFAARVTRIADQAEYTPRNVQTKEERQTTVYAVELTLLEGQDQLKPGMPADVTFEAAGAGS
ncbi:MAG: HlyD family secretion protein [Anaerolineales bacterium]|jgi:multidrug resistance efflux pump